MFGSVQPLGRNRGGEFQRQAEQRDRGRRIEARRELPIEKSAASLVSRANAFLVKAPC
jgi:hypothetical protein